MARELIVSLQDNHAERSVIAAEAPDEVLTIPDASLDLGVLQGVFKNEMNQAQQVLFRQLVEQVVKTLRGELADDVLAEISDAEWREMSLRGLEVLNEVRGITIEFMDIHLLSNMTTPRMKQIMLMWYGIHWKTTLALMHFVDTTKVSMVRVVQRQLKQALIRCFQISFCSLFEDEIKSLLFLFACRFRHEWTKRCKLLLNFLGIK